MISGHPQFFTLSPKLGRRRRGLGARLLNKKLLLLVAALAISPGSSEAVAGRETREVCLSLRGNGPKFPSLLGQVTALFQAGYVPRVSVGGSSGANIAAMVQALAENTSIQSAVNPAEAAAIVLSATRDLLDSFLFLPKFNDPVTLLRSIAKFVEGQLNSDKVQGPPQFAIAHLDHTLAQILLFVDFFANQDFSRLLSEPNPTQRKIQLQTLFAAGSRAQVISPVVFLRALLPASEEEVTGEEFQKLRATFRSYFALKTNETSPPIGANIERDERHAREMKRWLEKLSPSQLNWVRRATWNFLRESSFFPGPEMSNNATLFFPSGAALQSALQLNSSFSGKKISTPHGFLAHTTAFRGNTANPESIKQFYYGGDATQPAVRQLWINGINSGETHSLMSLPESPESTSVLHAHQTWVADAQHNLHTILQATIAEPLLFERRVIRMQSHELDELDTLDEQAKQANLWTANGGWLDTASYGLLSRLPVCQGHPIVLITPHDGVNSFQKQTLRGLLDLPKAQPGAPDPLSSAPLYTKLERYLRGSTAPSENKILLNFDWDHALKNKPQGVESVRSFLFDTSQLHARQILLQREHKNEK
ncbi:hypothetical protein EBU99_04085 [bacterium]|nr:hypothetical protein [bacterium]